MVCLLKRLPGSQFPNRRQLEITGRLEQARHIIELLEDGRYIVAADESTGDLGGAPMESRRERARRIALVRDWLSEDPMQTVGQLQARFASEGVTVSAPAVKKYKAEAIG